MWLIKINGYIFWHMSACFSAGCCVGGLNTVSPITITTQLFSRSMDKTFRFKWNSVQRGKRSLWRRHMRTRRYQWSWVRLPYLQHFQSTASLTLNPLEIYHRLLWADNHPVSIFNWTLMVSVLLLDLTRFGYVHQLYYWPFWSLSWLVNHSDIQKILGFLVFPSSFILSLFTPSLLCR